MLINIITRLSKYSSSLDFTRNVLSVKSQTYKKIRHLVIFDGERQDWIEKRFINFDNIEYFKADRFGNVDKGLCFFNLYFNDIRKEIKNGFIYYLDDDDYLADKNVIENVVKHINSEDNLYLFKMKWPNDKVIPSDKNFGGFLPIRGDIGGSCFMVHSKYMYKFEWDADRASDYRVLLQLFDIFDNDHRCWINEIVIKTGNVGRLSKNTKCIE